MTRCAYEYVFTTLYGHNACLRVCVGVGGWVGGCVGVGGCGCGGGGLWVCLASVSRPMCVFVFVIRVTARRFSLPLRTKIKS